MGSQLACFKWAMISKLLSKSFRNCLKAGYFPGAWKKTNVVLVHKKEKKQFLNNYRLVSLLPICSNFFEKIIFDTIVQHLMENILLNPNRILLNSCIHQLISVTHEISQITHGY